MTDKFWPAMGIPQFQAAGPTAVGKGQRILGRRRGREREGQGRRRGLSREKLALAFGHQFFKVGARAGFIRVGGGKSHVIF